MTFRDQDGASELAVQPAEAGSALQFTPDGGLAVTSAEGARNSRWQFRPDASVELELGDEQAGAKVLERIWFIKPNLRLRNYSTGCGWHALAGAVLLRDPACFRSPGLIR